MSYKNDIHVISRISATALLEKLDLTKFDLTDTEPYVKEYIQKYYPLKEVYPTNISY